MSKPFKRPESVLVLVYTEQGQVLMLQRCDDPDFWQSITGSLEAGEAPAQAAVRELFEETGISGVELIDVQHQVEFALRQSIRHRYAPGDFMNKEHTFLACLPEACAIRLSPSEHLRAEWLSARAAYARAWSWSNRQAIKHWVIDAPARRLRA